MLVDRAIFVRHSPLATMFLGQQSRGRNAAVVVVATQVPFTRHFRYTQVMIKICTGKWCTVKAGRWWERFCHSWLLISHPMLLWSLNHLWLGYPPGWELWQMSMQKSITPSRNSKTFFLSNIFLNLKAYMKLNLSHQKRTHRNPSIASISFIRSFPTLRKNNVNSHKIYLRPLTLPW